MRGKRQQLFSTAVNHYPLRRLRTSVQYHVGAVMLDRERERNFPPVVARLSFNWSRAAGRRAPASPPRSAA